MSVAGPLQEKKGSLHESGRLMLGMAPVAQATG